MNQESNYQHWTISIDDEQIAWLEFNRKDKSLNSLSREVLEEFNGALNEITQTNNVSGIVIFSGKSSGFIAGADIEQFIELKDENEAFELIRKGQQLLDRLDALSIPTVAMIKGFCLGGGMELALACRYRVVDEDVKTRLGLPEVKLGIHPGWGGTVRLPQLIGGLSAMDLILTGRTVTGKAAYRMGFVDAAVPTRQLKRAARFHILNKPKPRQASFMQRATNFPGIRHVLGIMLRRKVAQKALPEHYPSPFEVIDNWVHDGAKGEKAYLNEAKSIAKMLVTPTSRSLVRVFFLQEEMKALAKGEKFTPASVHVVGAGVMGGDIAAWCALRGMRVTLQDREAKYIAPAMKRAHATFKKKLKTPRAIQEAMDRLIPDPKGLGVPQADVIIEAIYENLEAKQRLFKDIEAKAKPDAILATNTSSIPLDEINTILSRPDRLVGIHFFNPVAMMMLVEVVRGEKTNQAVMDKAIAFVRSIDRLPLPVKSSPGFLINRVLMPYLMECVTLVEEGVPMAAIDKAAKKFGMPMGPVELADMAGLDVCLSVAKNLSKHFGGTTVPARLEAMVEKGELGRKSGKGFYEYKKGKAVKPSLSKTYRAPADLTDRLVMRMLNEAAACLREGVVEKTGLLDAGMIFGTGFAPFTGGPMNYVEALGHIQLINTLKGLEAAYGERFKPDPYWETASLPQKEEVVAS